MTVKLLDHTNFIRDRRTIAGRDDFQWFISPHLWTSTLTDSGGVTVNTTHAGGILITPSDGTVADNDEAYVGWTTKSIVFTNQKPVVVEFRINFTEANTSAQNVAVGLCSTTAANALLDDGGGPPGSYTGLLLFKTDGSTTWNAESSVGSTQTTTTLNATNSLDKTLHTAGGTTDQTLRIEFLPYSSTKAEVLFYIDDVLVASHDYVYTSAVAVSPVILHKQGSSTGETLSVRYAAWEYLR